MLSKKEEAEAAKKWMKGRHYAYLSELYLKDGLLDIAVPLAIKACELEPNSGYCHLNAGNILFAAGDYEISMHHYREAMRLTPKENKAIQQLIQQKEKTWQDLKDA